MRPSSSLVAALIVGGCAGAPPEASSLYAHPQRVTIHGYTGHAMEPFVSRDGRYLFFNNLNDPSVNTDIHYAERIDDLNFGYRGPLQGVNTPALEGVPTMDRDGTFYFVSTRSYEQTLSTVYRGRFADARLSGVELVPQLSIRRPGNVNFDVEVSPDGATLYSVEGRFSGGPVPQSADRFIATRRGDGFARAANSDALLRNVNTDALEYAACIAADGRTLLFTRLVEGSPAIYVSHRTDATAPFEKPKKLSAAEGFVEAPALSPDERSLYYHKRDGALFVIYRLTRQ
jgi:Tol biopolymer transport system component